MPEDKQERHCPDDCLCRQELDPDEPIRVEPVKSPRAIVSVALSSKDHEAISEAAERAGMKTSTYIRVQALIAAKNLGMTPLYSVTTSPGGTFCPTRVQENWTR